MRSIRSRSCRMWPKISAIPRAGVFVAAVRATRRLLSSSFRPCFSPPLGSNCSLKLTDELTDIDQMKRANVLVIIKSSSTPSREMFLGPLDLTKIGLELAATAPGEMEAPATRCPWVASCAVRWCALDVHIHF